MVRRLMMSCPPVLIFLAINSQFIMFPLITGDHIFGLPSLLLSLQLCAKDDPSKDTKVIQIFGPVGLYNYIATSLSLSYADLRFLSVEVYEFEGGSKRWKQAGAVKNYPEFRVRGLSRKSLPQVRRQNKIPFLRFSPNVFFN
jgi:ribonuclease BN (tRNA processing enzyme)